MQHINFDDHPRHEHFEMFRGFEIPHFNICADVDITNFRAYVKQQGISFTIATIYTLTRTANAIPEFRYRIRGEEVVKHEFVHPSSTIMGENDVFSFCGLEYIEDFPVFLDKSADKIARVEKRPRLVEEDGGRDDWLFMSSIPWVSFTSFTHPIKVPPDSVPRFAWGKFFEEGEILKMPLSVQGHHAVMDGLHVGRYFELIQESFHDPEKIFK